MEEETDGRGGGGRKGSMNVFAKLDRGRARARDEGRTDGRTDGLRTHGQRRRFYRTELGDVKDQEYVNQIATAI